MVAVEEEDRRVGQVVRRARLVLQVLQVLQVLEAAHLHLVVDAAALALALLPNMEAVDTTAVDRHGPTRPVARLPGA